MAFSDSQKRRLTEKAAAFGRQELEELAQLGKPDTIRKWFRMLVKEKWTFEPGNRKGRPPIDHVRVCEWTDLSREKPPGRQYQEIHEVL